MIVRFRGSTGVERQQLKWFAYAALVPVIIFAADLPLELKDLAHQAGVAVHAVRLTADLQRSRERLVVAREEERRRLRWDLHDGLGPRLASLTLRLEAARERQARDTAAAVPLDDLTERVREAVADIRRLVYGLRPSALDELGLLSALQEAAEQYRYQADGELEITVTASEPLLPLPAAVEVAAYRIVQEALTNVARHANARRYSVQLALDSRSMMLRVQIQDDGRGVAADRHVGGRFGLDARACRGAGRQPPGPAEPNGWHAGVRGAALSISRPHVGSGTRVGTRRTRTGANVNEQATHILIADDNPDFREALRDLLQVRPTWWWLAKPRQETKPSHWRLVCNQMWC